MSDGDDDDGDSDGDDGDSDGNDCDSDGDDGDSDGDSDGAILARNATTYVPRTRTRTRTRAQHARSGTLSPSSRARHIQLVSISRYP